MKIFISYKFADEDLIHLKEFMHKVKSSLQKSNHELLSTFFHQEEFEKSNATMRQIMDKALEYINKSDTVLCVVKAKEKSDKKAATTNIFFIKFFYKLVAFHLV